MKKTVHYYKMDLEFTALGEQAAARKTIPESEIIKVFQDVQKKLTGNSIRLPYEDKPVFLELLYMDQDYAFGKLSNKQDSSTIQVRNEETLECNPLQIDPGQSIEIFTYFLINLGSGIISFIFGMSAPRITRLQRITSLCDDATLKGYTAIITPVPRKNIVEVIKRKSVVGKLTYTFTLPSDEILSELLPMKEFFEVDAKKIKHQKVTVELKAEREKSFLKDNTKLGEMVDGIHEKFKDKLKSLKVDAKDKNENLKHYDLLGQNFTYQIDIDIKDITPLKIKDQLVRSYKEYEDELLSYVRMTTQKNE